MVLLESAILIHWALSPSHFATDGQSILASVLMWDIFYIFRVSLLQLYSLWGSHSDKRTMSAVCHSSFLLSLCSDIFSNSYTFTKYLKFTAYARPPVSPAMERRM